MEKEKTINALTFDAKEDGWETSQGFIMRQVPMPVLDEKKNPEDSLCIIVKINYAGVCGSDRGIWHRRSFKELMHQSLIKQGKTARILGHEFLGKIITQGSMVNPLYQLAAGNLVSGDSHVTCGNCYQCKIGQNNVCLNEKILGISTDGIFAEFVKIPAKNIWPVDIKKIRPEIAAMLDPFGNAVHAVSKVDVRGQVVAVFGAGPIGLFSILLLSHFGASNIIAVDVNEKNLAMAKELGAHEVIHIKNANLVADIEAVKKIRELTKGRGVDVAMEMAGPNSSVNNCLESTRRGGQVILFGLKDGDFVIPNFSRYIVKGLSIHGVIGRRIFETWQVAQSVLGDTQNGMQEKIWDVVLKQGKGTVINFTDFKKDSFEKAMNENPKVIFKM